MKAAVFSYTRNGAALSLKVADRLQKYGYATVLYTAEKYLEVSDKLLPAPHGCEHAAGMAFQEGCRVIVYIGSSGIAVRAVAPHLRSKTVDPAILVLDERARFVIPLLAGHIGGANALARKLAADLEAEAVITTATDVNGLFAVDEWAARNNLSIASMFAAKELSAALLDGELIGFESAYPVVDELPKGFQSNAEARVGLVIAANTLRKPFPVTLHLLPRVFFLGIGCRRGIAEEKIEALVKTQLAALKIDFRCVAGVASVDLKQDEEGLLSFVRKYGLAVNFYSAQELAEQDGAFSASQFVRKVVGVDNVCERSAMKAAGAEAKIILPKTAQEGVTLSVAQIAWQVKFPAEKEGCSEK